eukprot:9490401-Pyramimonas_sp.AAC.2
MMLANHTGPPRGILTETIYEATAIVFFQITWNVLPGKCSEAPEPSHKTDAKRVSMSVAGPLVVPQEYGQASCTAK